MMAVFLPAGPDHSCYIVYAAFVVTRVEGIAQRVRVAAHSYGRGAASAISIVRAVRYAAVPYLRHVKTTFNIHIHTSFFLSRACNW